MVLGHFSHKKIVHHRFAVRSFNH